MKVAVDTLIASSVKAMGSGIHAVVKESAIKLIELSYKEGIYVKMTSGFRSFAEQTKLYNQGRTNNEPIVTNAKAGQSNHNYGLAIDYVLLSEDGKKAIWTVNNDWKRVATIGKSLGFEWGGDWKSFKDYPHLEMMGGLSIKDLQAGKKPNLKSKATAKQAVNKVEVKETKKKAVAKKPVVPFPKKVFKVKSPLMTGKDVERIQRALGLKEKEVDGKYGNDTAKLVKAYQKRKGLSADGQVGESTWNMMF